MNKSRVPRISLDLLRGFHAAARHLSFTRAASELCVTQPAISREVKTLEDQLGQPLFRRVNRRLELTKAGETLSRCADEVFGLIDAAVRDVAGASRSFSVTASVPFASLWLGPRLPAFAHAHPEIDLRVAASNDVDNLDRARLDVAIRYFPHGKAPRDADRLCDYMMFPICSKAFARSVAQPLATCADLAGQVLLDFETIIDGRRWSDWDKWRDALHPVPARAKRVLRFSHYDQVIRAVATDGGIAIGKWPHLADELRRGVVHAPLGAAAVASLGGLYAVVSASSATNAAARGFVQWLKTELAKDARRMPPALRARQLQ
jgi:DNA-binding transcriptional LysR family regulator